MKGWFKLYSTRNSAEASIIKGMLEENNIKVIILNKLDSSYINFGDIELYVPAHLKDLAKNLLDQSQSLTN
jgi:Putative prokaryotic signal transducing protein